MQRPNGESPSPSLLLPIVSIRPRLLLLLLLFPWGRKEGGGGTGERLPFLSLSLSWSHLLPLPPLRLSLCPTLVAPTPPHPTTTEPGTPHGHTRIYRLLLLLIRPLYRRSSGCRLCTLALRIESGKVPCCPYRCIAGVRNSELIAKSNIKTEADRDRAACGVAQPHR